MHCQFQHIQGIPAFGLSNGKTHYRCVHCGKVTEGTSLSLVTYQAQYESTHPFACTSPSPRTVQPLPSLPRRFWNYLKAYQEFLRTGSKTRTPERVLEIFATYCSPCKRYHDLAGACSVCGCYVNPVGTGQVANMILWANESCPDQPPKWKAEETEQPQETELSKPKIIQEEGR